MASMIRLTDIPDDFGEHFLPYRCSLRQRIQGRKFANESYIDSVRIFRGNDDGIDVKSRIFRSQRKGEDPHTVNFSMSKTAITIAHCSCKAGIVGECSHVLAVVLKITDWILDGLTDVPSQPSSTSCPQQWDKPRGSKIQAEPVSTMVLSRSSNVTRKKRPMAAIFNDNRKIGLTEKDISLLASLNDTPLGYLACTQEQTIMTEKGPQAVGSTLSHQIPLIQHVDDVLGQREACGSLDLPARPNVNLDIISKHCDNLKHVSVTYEEARVLELNTRDQCSSVVWAAERQKRITASHFGRIMLRKAPINEKFINSITKAKAFTSASTSYGIANERIARNMYRKKTNNHVHDCGLFVNPEFPFIGATPDGKVCASGETGILEIKCPFSVRDMAFADILDKTNPRKDFFLITDGENITLNKAHQYWFQVQGQLLVTGAKFCDFVTYTRRDLLITRILPEKETMENILVKMCDVYKNIW